MKSINEKIKEVLFEDDQLLLEVVEQINSLSGDLEELRFYSNDKYFFDEYFSSPYEALLATQRGEYKIGHKYVRFDGLGNLESFEEYDMMEEIRNQIDEIIDLYLENDYKLNIDVLYDIVCEDLEELDEE